MFVEMSQPSLEPVDASWNAGTGSRVANVVDRIVDRIAGGELRSGDRLAEPFLEREFGASRYTVREALRVLVTQGVLEKVPYSGCRVAQFDEARFRQIYMARLHVELLALPDAISVLSADPALLALLDAALARLAAAADSDGDRRYAEADLAFHRTICFISGNRIVCRLWDTLLPHVRIVRAILGDRVSDLAAHVAEHQRLRDAIASGDGRAAESALRAHLLGHLRGEGVEHGAALPDQFRGRQSAALSGRHTKNVPLCVDPTT